MTTTPQPAPEMVETIGLIMNIISIARFEQEHPYGLHLTAFSLIEKAARQVLAAFDAALATDQEGDGK